ncbi:MAG: SBBP repeat-containing protein [Chloroflexia bacterium]
MMQRLSRLLLALFACGLALAGCDLNNLAATPTPAASAGVNGWTVEMENPTAPALLQASSIAGALRLKPDWIVAGIEYSDADLGLGSPLQIQSERITRQGNEYKLGTATVPQADVKALVASLDHLYPAQMLMTGHAWTDDYPSWSVELTGTDGTHLLLSAASTGNPGNGPWNLVYNGLLYAQYDGAVAGPLGKLFGGRLATGGGDPNTGRAAEQVDFATNGLPPEIVYGFWGLLPIRGGFSYTADPDGSKITGLIQPQGQYSRIDTGEISALDSIQISAGPGAPAACSVKVVRPSGPSPTPAWEFTCPVAGAQKGKPYRYTLLAHFSTSKGAPYDTAGELWGTWGNTRDYIVLPPPPDISKALSANPAARDLLTDHLLVGTRYDASLTVAAPMAGDRNGEALLFGQTLVDGKPVRYTVGAQFVIHNGGTVYWDLDRTALTAMLKSIAALPLTHRVLQADPQAVLNLWYAKGTPPKTKSNGMDDHRNVYAADVNTCWSVPGGSFPSERPLMAFSYNASPYFDRAPFVLINGQAVVADLALRSDKSNLVQAALLSDLPTGGAQPLASVWMETAPYGGGGPTLHLILSGTTAAEQAAHIDKLQATLPVQGVFSEGELLVHGVTLAPTADGKLAVVRCAAAPTPTSPGPPASASGGHTQPPRLVYSTLYGSTDSGGRNSTGAAGLAVDASGRAYITGMTSAPDLPLKNAYQSALTGGLWDLYVAGFEPDGSALHYAGYRGSGTETIGTSIALDGQGNIYITGSARQGFQTTAKAIQADVHGDADAFVMKLSADGQRVVYATLLGGKDYDEGLHIAVDSQGAAYVVGTTSSADFPVEHALQAGFGSKGAGSSPASDAFVAKISPDGSRLIYSTFLGGTNADAAYGVAADSSGDAYVTGATLSSDFPLAHPLQSKLGGDGDAFVAKISPDGSRLIYSTFLGGAAGAAGGPPNSGKSLDVGAAIVVDTAGDAFVTGNTTSPDFPLVKPLYSTFNGGVRFAQEMDSVRDAFIAKLNPNGSALLFSSFLGGTSRDRGRGIGLDAAGNIYVGGSTTSPDFPMVRPLQAKYAGSKFGLAPDSFITKLNPQASALIYSTYFGGSGFDDLSSFAVDPTGNVFLAGEAEAPNKDFPLAGKPFQSVINGYRSAFVAKIADDGP